MRRLLVILLLGTSAFAQFTSTARHIAGGTALPATCNPGPNGDVFTLYNAVAVTSTTYTCTALNTWTILSSGGFTGTVTSVGLVGTANQITVTGASPITTSGSWTLSIPTTFALPGGVTMPISTKTTTYAVLSTDYTIRCDATGGGFTLTLPASPGAGEIHNIKKIDSTANTCTVSGNGHNIDGSGTIALSAQFTSFNIQYDSTSGTWNVI